MNYLRTADGTVHPDTATRIWVEYSTMNLMDTDEYYTMMITRSNVTHSKGNRTILLNDSFYAVIVLNIYKELASSGDIPYLEDILWDLELYNENIVYNIALTQVIQNICDPINFGEVGPAIEYERSNIWSELDMIYERDPFTRISFVISVLASRKLPLIIMSGRKEEDILSNELIYEIAEVIGVNIDFRVPHIEMSDCVSSIFNFNTCLHPVDNFTGTYLFSPRDFKDISHEGVSLDWMIEEV